MLLRTASSRQRDCKYTARRGLSKIYSKKYLRGKNLNVFYTGLQRFQGSFSLVRSTTHLLKNYCN